MQEQVLLIFLIACPILWMLSARRDGTWKYRNGFLLVNIPLFFLIQTLIIKTDLIDTGHDRYGYGHYIVAFFACLFHNAASFAISFGISLTLKK